jgi:hypothetical protein
LNGLRNIRKLRAIEDPALGGPNTLKAEAERNDAGA